MEDIELVEVTRNSNHSPPSAVGLSGRGEEVDSTRDAVTTVTASESTENTNQNRHDHLNGEFIEWRSLTLLSFLHFSR